MKPCIKASLTKFYLFGYKVFALACAVFLLELHAQEAVFKQCIRYQADGPYCYHTIIRSINSQDDKFKNKALCLCLSDLPESLQQSTLDANQLSLEQKQVLLSLQKSYHISQDDLIELITGARSSQSK